MMKSLSPLVLAACLTQLVSCGKSDGGKSSTPAPSSSTSDHDQVIEEPQGIYRAVLATVNEQAGNHKSMGTADIKINEDNVEVRLTMVDTPAKVPHLQYIVAGKCPKKEQDPNQDGFLDAQEAGTLQGKILVPLDGDLNAQSLGGEAVPRSDSSGFYNYTKTASLGTMLEDLRLPQVDDLMLKLSAEEGINLSERHIIVLGVPEGIDLPETVAGIKDISPNASLPIACGDIVRVQEEE